MKNFITGERKSKPQIFSLNRDKIPFSGNYMHFKVRKGGKNLIGFYTLGISIKTDFVYIRKKFFSRDGGMTFYDFLCILD